MICHSQREAVAIGSVALLHSNSCAKRRWPGRPGPVVAIAGFASDGNPRSFTWDPTPWDAAQRGSAGGGEGERLAPPSGDAVKNVFLCTSFDKWVPEAMKMTSITTVTSHGRVHREICLSARAHGTSWKAYNCFVVEGVAAVAVDQPRQKDWASDAAISAAKARRVASASNVSVEVLAW